MCMVAITHILQPSNKKFRDLLMITSLAIPLDSYNSDALQDAAAKHD